MRESRGARFTANFWTNGGPSLQRCHIRAPITVCRVESVLVNRKEEVLVNINKVNTGAGRGSGGGKPPHSSGSPPDKPPIITSASIDPSVLIDRLHNLTER